MSHSVLLFITIRCSVKKCSFVVYSLRSKRSSVYEANEILHSGRAEKWAESKKVEGRGCGRGKRGTLARKPLEFEKRPLDFTVEFFY